MSFAWIQSWWRCFGAGYQIRVYIVSAGERPIAIFPFVIRRKEGFRELCLLGVGKSDYLDFIIDHQHIGPSIDALFDMLASSDNGWDVFRCTRFREDSATFKEFVRRLEGERRLHSAVRGFTVAPFLAIDGSWSEYYAGFPKSFRNDTARQMKRLEREVGPLQFRTISSLDEFTRIFPEMIGFHKKRRNVVKNDYSMFNDVRNKIFYTSLARDFIRPEIMQCDCLYAGDILAAASISFVMGGKFYYLVPVINHDFQKYSPGRVLLFWILERSFRDNLREFDLGYGGEPYKYQIAATQRSLKEVLIARQSLRGYLAFQWFSHVREIARRSSFIMQSVVPKLKALGLVRESS